MSVPVVIGIDYNVYQGFWTNWSYDRVRGATLTLSQQNGRILIASLAIFVAMLGKMFWRIGCFILHHWFSCEGPQDGLYHRKRAILRNVSAASDGVWEFLHTG